VDAVIAHIQLNWKTYGIVLVCVLPFVIIFRKWAVPLILYVFEYCIYLGIMHTLMHGIVGLATWFRQETQFRALSAGGRVFGWHTPWVHFWRKELYNPQWLVYLEIGFAVVVLALMIKFRPMQRQKVKARSNLSGIQKPARGLNRKPRRMKI